MQKSTPWTTAVLWRIPLYLQLKARQFSTVICCVLYSRSGHSSQYCREAVIQSQKLLLSSIVMIVYNSMVSISTARRWLWRRSTPYGGWWSMPWRRSPGRKSPWVWPTTATTGPCLTSGAEPWHEPSAASRLWTRPGGTGPTSYSTIPASRRGFNTPMRAVCAMWSGLRTSEAGRRNLIWSGSTAWRVWASGRWWTWTDRVYSWSGRIFGRDLG